ncbi:rCG42641 [Rattus norvegicus]|uniref:RCG42641 n=1 Tax=Rattus norvegicus TaxID=10116 RepID=A6K158_RAT|nr:rCG42641 [Rattus norvegicus]
MKINQCHIYSMCHERPTRLLTDGSSLGGKPRILNGKMTLLLSDSWPPT